MSNKNRTCAQTELANKLITVALLCHLANKRSPYEYEHKSSF